MPLRGDLEKLRSLRTRLRSLPIRLAQDVAEKAAPAMTELAKDAYESGRNVYGEPRPLGESGAALTLRKTGDTERDLRFVSVGTVVRCVLGPRYAKYLIGKYGVLPNGRLPVSWSARLAALVKEAGAAGIGGGS